MSFRLYPPIWFLTLICLQVVLARNFPSALGLPEAIRYLGGATIAVGVVIFIAAIRAFKQHQTTILPFEDSSERLIDSGVFRISRNPVYLSEAIILIGIALCSGHGWPWLVIPGFVIGIDRSVIAWEEQVLRRRFGPAYDSYCRRTRRWL